MPEQTPFNDEDRLRIMRLMALDAGGGDAPAAAAPPPSFLQDVTSNIGMGLPGAIGAAIGTRMARQGNQDAASGAARGIGTEAAPAGARFAAGFGTDDADAYRRALSQQFGGRPVNVEPDAQTGRLVWTHPDTGARNFVTGDPARILNAGDVASLAGPALTAAGSVAGGVGGALGGAAGGAVAGAGVGAGAAVATAGALNQTPGTEAGAGALGAALGAGLGTIGGPLIGGTLGTAFGTWVADAARLLTGQQMGVVDPEISTLDIMRRSMPGALIEGAGALGTGIAYRVYRAIAGRGAARISAEEFTRLWQEAEQRTAPLGAQPTSAQILSAAPPGSAARGEADRLLMEQQRLTTPGSPLAQRQDQNMQALAGRVGAEEVPNPETMGRGARAAATADRQAELGPIEEATSRARAQAQDALAAVTEGVPGQTPSQAGAQIRQGFRRAVDAFDQQAEQRFGAIREQAQGVAGTPDNLIAAAQRHQAQLTGDVIPGLAEEDSRLIRGILQQNVGENGALREVPYDTVNRAISQLRRRIRELDTGAASGGDVAMLRDLRGALVADRNAMLERANRGDLIQQIAETENWYRGEKDLLERGIVGRLLSVRNGAPTVQDADVFDRVFRHPDNAVVVQQVLSRPGMEAEREQVRQAIRARWASPTNEGGVVGADGAVDVRAASRWAQNYRSQIDGFFTPEEQRIFNSAALAQRTFQQQAAEARRLTDEFNSTLGGRLSPGGDPAPIADIRNASQVFDRTYRGSAPIEDTRATVNLLTRYAQTARDSGPLDAFRAMARQDARDAFYAAGDASTRPTMDLAALTAYVANGSPTARKLALVDPEYLAGLRQLRGALSVVQAQPGAVAQPASRLNTMLNLVRGATGFGRPLSREGLFVSGARAGIAEASDRVLQRLLLDPEAMRQAIRMGTMTPADFAQALTAGGVLTDWARE